MKKKYLLFGGAGVAVVAAAVLLILLLTKKGEKYRTILVLETKGDVTVQRDGGTISAYQDMRLRNGDGMKVPGGGLARLKLDSDKFVYLEENTTISLQAAGTAADSRTIIYVEEGNMLTEVQQKLSVDSSYDVVTPNTTMAIRGTVTQTIVRKGMADADQAVTEYSGEDGADSKKKTGKERLCWITDIFIYEGSASVTVYNIDGADIVYRNRTLTAGNGIHVVTPVEETAGNDYVRQFQVDDTRVFWGPRDTRPDGQTGKVREATDNLNRGLSHISLAYAASYFPKSVNPKDIKGAGGKLDDKSTKTILKSRGEDPDNDVPPTPTPTEPPAETPTPVPSPSEGPTPPEELTPTPEELTPTPDQTTPVPTKAPTQVPGGVTPATNNNENKVSPQTEPETEPKTEPETEPETKPETEPTTEPTATTHTIYYYADPTGVSQTGEYEEGKGLSELLVLDDTNTQYFEGWTDEDGFPVDSIPTTATEDISLYASWSPMEFEVFFYVNNNFYETDLQYYTYGDSIPAEEFPYFSDDYLTLDYWAEGSANGPATKGIFPGDYGDKSYYAVTKATVYSISYYLDADKNPARVADEYKTYEAGIGRGVAGGPSLPTLPNTATHTFVGWAFDAESTTTDYIGLEDCTDVELFALWKPIEYTITYYSGGQLKGTEHYNAGSAVTLMDTDIGWYAPGDYDAEYTTLPAGTTGNKIFYEKKDGDVATIVFLNADGSVNYQDTVINRESFCGIPEPPGTYTTWVGTNGTNYTLTYDPTESIHEFMPEQGDMFFKPGN